MLGVEEYQLAWTKYGAHHIRTMNLGMSVNPISPHMACTRMGKGACTLDHIHEGWGAVRESVSPQVSGRIHNHVATGIHQELICLPVVGHVRYLGVPGWGVFLGCTGGVSAFYIMSTKSGPR